MTLDAFDGSAARAPGSPPLPAMPGAPSAGYAPLSSAALGEVHITDYLRILYKRRWTATAAFLLFLGMVVAYTFSATPRYEARVQVLIESDTPNVVKFQEVIEQNKAAADYYQTQYRILQSRRLARRVLDAERLWDHPSFAGASTPKVSAWGSLRDTLLGGLSNNSEQSGVLDASETTTQSIAIDRFLRGLVVSPIRNSRLVDIRYQSTEPVLAARVANALARQYIDQSLEFKYTATMEASEFLTKRMGEQRQSLEQSEVALQKYREANDSVSLEDKQNIVIQRLADLNSAVTKARTERIQKESVWNQIRGIQNDRSMLDTHPLIIGNAFIQSLKTELGNLQRQQAQYAEKLGDRHPDMMKVRSAIQATEAKLEAEAAKVVQAIRNDYDAAAAQERSLTTALDQQKNEALNLNRQSIEYGSLQRDAVSNRQLFEGLLQRAKETGIEGELKSSNIRIVDAAEVPRTRSSPNVANNFVLGLFGGAFLGIGLAFFFEYFDNRIKSPDELRTHLGLPFLGLVPAVSEEGPTTSRLLTNAVPAQFAEAFRTIRTNVLFSSTDNGPRSVVVTSTMPGEGKTLVSSNLAIALSHAGQRVLLIDADMRRPKVHEFFAMSQEPGLSNVMVGEAKASEGVKRTSSPNLWIMAAGRIPPNPAELLGSRRFKDFLRSLSDHFDWVVIDSPPVMAVTDACVAGHSANGVLFVVGAEMTPRGTAKAALDQLDSAKVKYIGAVLNRVDLHRNAYYYSQYYRREYSSYYQTPAAEAGR